MCIPWPRNCCRALHWLLLRLARMAVCGNPADGQTSTSPPGWTAWLAQQFISEFTTDMPRYKSYLLIENPSKGNNLGPLLRCACAFGVTEVIFVGFAQCSTEGSHGSARHVSIRAFPTFEQAENYLRGKDCGVVDIVGVLGGTWNHHSSSPVCVYNNVCNVSEYKRTSADVNGRSVVRKLVAIDDGADSPTFRRVCNSSDDNSHRYPPSIPAHRRKFRGNTAFFVSKNWRGLPAEHAAICDSFLHVPHLAATTEESSQAMFVDIQSSISIILHHFTAWAQYDERESEGQKFDVAVYQKGQISEREKAEKAAKRAKIREASSNVLEELASASGDIFGVGNDDGDY